MHGKLSYVHHKGRGVFQNLPDQIEVTRYHSLVVSKSSVPDCLEITAWTEMDDGTFDEVMAFRHREFDVEGVQFHPESIKTQAGHELLSNFLRRNVNGN